MIDIVSKRTVNGLDNLANLNSVPFGHMGSSNYPALLCGM